jgi:uncharacterized protein YkwD
MIFHPCFRYATAALGVALLISCSATVIPLTLPVAPITPISQSTQSTHIIPSRLSTSAAQDSPSFIKIVDVKPDQSLCVTADMHAQVLSQVNQIRAQGAVCGGVRYPPAKPLRWSTKLQQTADKHSQDMATQNFFNHKSVSNGSTLVERLHSVDYSYRSAGENIGAGPATVAQVMDMWVTSPAHCVTIMTAHFADLGVSCKNNSNSKYTNYWTLKAAAPF